MEISQLQQLTPRVYWLPPDERTDRPVLGVIVGSQATLIVDAGNSAAHANLLLDQLVEHDLIKPKSYIVLTHWHWDHVFGAATLEEWCAERSGFDTTIFAHQETARYVEEMAHLDWSDAALDQRVADGTEIEFCRDMIKAELPDRTNLRIKPADVAFASELTFNLGDITCQVTYVGGDHSSDSSVVYIPAGKGENILFLSDCLYEDLHHGPRNYTIEKLFPLLDAIESYDADYYLWGHDDVPMPRAEMTEFIRSLRIIGQAFERIGDNREALVAALPSELNAEFNEEHLEIVDAFLAGRRRVTP